MENKNLKELGNLIRKTRHKQQLTIVELSKKIGRVHTHLARIELGQRCPTNEDLQKIANILSIPYEELLEIRGPFAE